MNLAVKRILGVAAAVTIGTPALLGTAALPAVAAAGVYCERAGQDLWDDGPSRSVTARGCDIPSHRNRWYTVEIDTLVQTRYKGDTLDGGVERTRSLHHRTIRCLGYTTGTETGTGTGTGTDTEADKGTITWFGCPPL